MLLGVSGETKRCKREEKLDQSEDAIRVRCAGFGRSHDQFVQTDPRIQTAIMSQ